MKSEKALEGQPHARGGWSSTKVAWTVAACAYACVCGAIVTEPLAGGGTALIVNGTAYTSDEKAALMRESIREAVLSEPHAIQMHGFYVNEEKKTIRFDVVISFDAKDRKAVYEGLYAKVHGLYPDYALEMTLDTDFSES